MPKVKIDDISVYVEICFISNDWKLPRNSVNQWSLTNPNG